ncbi:MAG: hypothetical protein JW803_05380 [Endomicrobiales bacterium]|nr:hypothetical protein [Endomicrobiales bacterium]
MQNSKRITIVGIVTIIVLNTTSFARVFDAVGEEVFFGAVEAQSNLISYASLSVLPLKIMHTLFSEGICIVKECNSGGKAQKKESKRKNHSSGYFITSDFKNVKLRSSTTSRAQFYSSLEGAVNQPEGQAGILDPRRYQLSGENPALMLLFLIMCLLVARASIGEGASILISNIKNEIRFRMGPDFFYSLRRKVK